MKEIAQARKYFADEGIDDKLALAGRESAIRQEAADKQTLLDDLLKAYASIEEKYNIARGKLEMHVRRLGTCRKKHIIRNRPNFR